MRRTLLLAGTIGVLVTAASFSGLLERAELGFLNRRFEVRNAILTTLGRPSLPCTPVVIVMGPAGAP